MSFGICHISLMSTSCQDCMRSITVTIYRPKQYIITKINLLKLFWIPIENRFLFLNIFTLRYHISKQNKANVTSVQVVYINMITISYLKIMMLLIQQHNINFKEYTFIIYFQSISIMALRQNISWIRYIVFVYKQLLNAYNPDKTLT